MLFDNYTLWLTGVKAHQLDKDLLVPGNKVYSKDTCILATTKENCTHNVLTGALYRGTRLTDGYTELFRNKSEFARTYKLNNSHIHQVIIGNYKAHKGWQFEIVEENKEGEIIGKDK